jgi:hypothetical protein
VEETETPDPTDVSRVLTSDLQALQKIVDFAVEDTINIAAALGIDLQRDHPDTAPRQVLYEVLIPKMQLLMVEHGFVEAARSEIKVAAKRFGNKTIEHEGVRGLKVGQKIPGLFEKTRAARREAEREAKRRG